MNIRRASATLVDAISEQGERLNIRKATLRQWREEFANQLRRVGVVANATSRFVRGASTHMRERVETAAVAPRTADRVGEPAKLRLRQTRPELERGWHATSEALRSQGQTALAEQTRQFVHNLPPATTERKWLVAGLVGQVQGNRERERADHLARSR